MSLVVLEHFWNWYMRTSIDEVVNLKECFSLVVNSCL